MHSAAGSSSGARLPAAAAPRPPTAPLDEAHLTSFQAPGEVGSNRAVDGGSSRGPWKIFEGNLTRIGERWSTVELFSSGEASGSSMI